MNQRRHRIPPHICARRLLALRLTFRFIRIQNRCRYDGVSKDRTPVPIALVRSQNDAASFVPRADQLKEDRGSALQHASVLPDTACTDRASWLVLAAARGRGGYGTKYVTISGHHRR